MGADVVIGEATEADWGAIAMIYQQGIDSGMATFEAAPPNAWGEWVQGKVEGCCLAARCAGKVVGWAALSHVSGRACYAGVADVSIYVRQDRRGTGLGARLLAALIAVAEAHGVWTLQASVIPENAASLHVLAHHGFRLVGRRERIGRMRVGAQAGMWRDTLLLERRSAVVGT